MRQQNKQQTNITTSNLLASLLSVSGITLISRILGFVRDALMARYIGASWMADAFIVAYRIPNLLRRVFAEGAFSQAFVPLLAEFKANNNQQQTNNFIKEVAGLLIFVLSFLVVLGIIFANSVVLLTAPGFIHDPNKLQLTTTLLRITFPYILLISLASLMGGILNTWRNFIIPAAVPSVLNLSFIIVLVFFSHFFRLPVMAMAFAVIVGGIFQLLMQAPYVKKIGIGLIPTLPKLHRLSYIKQSSAFRVVKLMAPALFATSIAQISLVINTIFASFLPTGSVSWLFFADRLMEFPTGVLGVALGTILLPNLSRHANTGNTERFSLTLDWGVRLCLLLAIPATVGLALIAKPLTMTLFMYGKFSIHDANMTAEALMAYSLGLLGLILVKIFAPGFYARLDIKTPVKVAVMVLIATQLMNLCFIGIFKHAGLALAIGIGACINAATLCYLLVKKGIYQSKVSWLNFLLKIVMAVVVMVLCVLLVWHLGHLNFTGNAFSRLLALIVLLIVAGISYFGLLFTLGVRVKDFIFHETYVEQ